MISEPTLGAIRFGYGPAWGRRSDAEQLLNSLAGPDFIAAVHPTTPTAEALRLRRALAVANRAEREGRVPDVSPDDIRAEGRALVARDLAGGFQRIVATPAPFRERLVWFWFDHFTVAAKNIFVQVATAGYIDEVVRPNVTGKFPDMLKSAVRHPAMLAYLDQAASFGPNSVAGKRRNRGLNENLAREVLELHTLGVDGPYTQRDVQQLAELFTGLSFDDDGFRWRSGIAEPGAEMVLGKPYGGPTPGIQAIDRALDDLALHPSTARHLARKIAAHFVSDTPDPHLVNTLEAAYLKSNGDLLPVYAALLDHPAAWEQELRKVRQPRDYLAALLIALGVSSDRLGESDTQRTNRLLGAPLRLMGQPHLRPGGPDGWPEEADFWITPQGLASRITVAKRIGDRAGTHIHDPRLFLDQVLGDAASPALRFAVNAAETRSEAVALILASVEMNRR